MLFWLFVIILVVGIVLMISGSKDWDRDKNKETKLSRWLYFHDDNLFDTGLGTVLVSGAVLFIMILILACEYTHTYGALQENRETYNALTYKVESGICRDEFGLLNKEIIDEIQEWNEGVVYNQTMHDNFWVGIFHPDIYDGLETIDYEKYAKE